MTINVCSINERFLQSFDFLKSNNTILKKKFFVVFMTRINFMCLNLKKKICYTQNPIH